MKAIYFGDPAGDLFFEKQSIIEELLSYGIQMEIEITDLPPFDKKFDILFFDWGGMSVGNSLLQHFCNEIIEQAEEHPSRIYIMTSTFTRWAMTDAIDLLKDRPANIFLELDDDAVSMIKSYL